MQFGSLPRVLKVGCVVLFPVFVVLTARAQFPDIGQTLGSASGQQGACNPQDIACQATQQNSGQGTTQGRIPQQGQQQPTPTQGVTLPGQENSTVDTTNNLTQQQRQLLQPKLPLDAPTEFQ